MTKKKFLYGCVLRLGTLQFDGHVHDYFVENSKKLVEFYLLPRAGKIKNFISLYREAKLIEKREVVSPKTIIFAYLTFYMQYASILFTYFKRKEKIFFINSLPVFFFFNSFWKLFRKIEMIYWVQDFWPMNNWQIKIFRFLMYYYHKRTKYKIYVTDRINKAMNKGSIIKGKTVMLGTKSPNTGFRKSPKKNIKLCFVGVLKKSQGMELILCTVAARKDIILTLIGTGEKSIVEKITKMIADLQIKNRVYFPNVFLYKEQLAEKIEDSHVGIVLYEEDKNTVAYYADPAKLKQYAEFGLPIITTKISETARYISKFQAGEIVGRDEKSIMEAILKIKSNYKQYLKGVEKFCRYFNYKEYYRKRFKFMETK